MLWGQVFLPTMMSTLQLTGRAMRGQGATWGRGACGLNSALAECRAGASVSGGALQSFLGEAGSSCPGPQDTGSASPGHSLACSSEAAATELTLSSLHWVQDPSLTPTATPTVQSLPLADTQQQLQRWGACTKPCCSRWGVASTSHSQSQALDSI